MVVHPLEYSIVELEYSMVESYKAISGLVELEHNSRTKSVMLCHKTFKENYEDGVIDLRR